MVYFAPGSLEKALADIKRTKLEACFSLNASLPRERRLRYPDVPLHYTWNGKERRWDPRLQLPHAEIITRMVQVSTREVERHSLPKLLRRIRDATSFGDMKRPRSATLELLEAGQPRSLTYRDALRRLGNEGDQEHADRTLHELVRDSDGSPMELLRTFATLLAFSSIPDAKALWAKYQTHFTGGQCGSRNANVAMVQLWGDCGMDPTRTTLQQPGLQLGCANPPDVIMREQMRWERRRQEETVAENLVLMNDDQRRFFDRVRAAVTNREPLLCYLDGPAGTGKTLLFSTVLAPPGSRAAHGMVGPRRHGAAWGRTVHATFKLPVPMPTADASSRGSVRQRQPGEGRAPHHLGPRSLRGRGEDVPLPLRRRHAALRWQDRPPGRGRLSTDPARGTPACRRWRTPPSRPGSRTSRTWSASHSPTTCERERTPTSRVLAIGNAEMPGRPSTRTRRASPCRERCKW